MASWFRNIFGNRDRSPDLPEDFFPNDHQAFHNNPYPYYRRLREKAPFYRTPEGVWVLSRYRDIKSALDHPSLGNSPSRFSTLNASKSDRFVCASLANNIMPFLDGIPHKEQRRQVARVFQKEVKAYLPRLNELAREAVANLGHEIRIIHDFAHPFALRMICGILGIPVDERLRDWSGSFFYLFTKIPTAEVREEVDQHLTEFRNWVKACLEKPASGGVLASLSALVEAGELDRQIAIDTIILLFADGLENVDSGLGNAFLAFAQNPSQWDKLRADESLVSSAVAEILRFDSPAQYIARTCLEDFEWQGHHFKKDLTVILLLASANHDDEVFDSPEQFDISRNPNPHLSFGHGKHSCLGSRLVEYELAAILAALRTKVSSIELSGDIRWQTRTGHHWMKEGHFRLKI